MNKELTKTNQKLSRAIMRRVWYTYSLSLVLSQSALWGFAFGASVIGFWKLVSITSIAQNLMAVELGRLPIYVWQSIAQAETLALIAFGIIIFTILSVGIKVTIPTLNRTQKLSSI